MLTFGQQGIFEYAEERTVHLGTEKMELLETMRSKPQVVNIFLVAITSVSAIGNTKQISMNLPDEELLTIQRTSLTTTKLNQIRWNGNTGEAASEVRLLITEEGITGMIRSNNHNYDIHPFSDTGFHLLVEIDPSKFEHELPPLTLEVEPESQ